MPSLHQLRSYTTLTLLVKQVLGIQIYEARSLDAVEFSLESAIAHMIMRLKS
ncbi:MAG: hypothetical protein V7K48_02625 [Nostoc sp.]|uniref:hypothetical protein n=1 Tax=Nostoc sp. TaxID=1180 RepID=UPI002FF548A0